MDRITTEELYELAQADDGMRISLSLHTEKAGRETRENPIRWKNLVREAEKELIDLGLRPEDAKRLIEPARKVEEDGDFWQHQEDGLVAFVSDEGLRLIRVPISVPDAAVVASRFNLKPLLPLFFENGPFYLLALSQNSVRFFRGNRFRLTEVDVPELPRSMREALSGDEYDDQLQFHTVNTGTSGRGDAVFHSSGDEAQARHKTDILRFCQRVNASISNYLRSQRAPLVVACVEYLKPIYDEANSYQHLLGAAVTGNPEDVDQKALGEAAWEIAQDHYKERQRHDAERFGNSIGRDLATIDLEAILLAAYQGRIDTLWVSQDEMLWGNVGDDGSGVEVHEERTAGDQDLLDIAAVQTLLNGGRVHAVPPDEIPQGGQMAAILRY